MTREAGSTREVEDAVAQLNLALRTHGGAVECTGVVGTTLKLRMTGLCAGCLFKPVTVAATIAPYIRERLGLEVELEGSRISEEAHQRLVRALAATYEPPRRTPIARAPRRPVPN
jgi:Fe-S cluster biogenesis protein NfuA